MIELPESIEKSLVLTSSEKNQLQDIQTLPVVDPSFDDDKLRNIFQYYSLTPEEMDVELQKYAAELIAEGKVKEAWQVLLTSA